MSWIRANVYQFFHNFAKEDYKDKNGPIRVPIPNPDPVSHVLRNISRPNDPVFMEDGRCLLLSLSTEDDKEHSIGQVMALFVCENGSYRKAPYGVTIEITSICTVHTACSCHEECDSVSITNGRVPNKDSPFQAKLFHKREVFLNKKLQIELIFNSWPTKRSVGNCILDDLLKFVSNGNQVTLMGYDGNVFVPRRLLQARSQTFEAMFTHDMEEKQNSQINLSDVSMNTLEAFTRFLSTDKVIFNAKTIIELYIIGDKYNIQSLKLLSRKLMLEHKQDLNSEEVYNVISKIEPDLIEKIFVKEYIFRYP